MTGLPNLFLDMGDRLQLQREKAIGCPTTAVSLVIYRHPRACAAWLHRCVSERFEVKF